MPRTAITTALQRGVWRLLTAAIESVSTPRQLARRGRVFGAIAWLTVPGWHQRIRHNLQLIYGDTLDAKAKRRIARGVFEHSGRSFCELLMNDRRPALRPRHLMAADGEPHLRRAVDEGRGVIVAAPHLGAWTLIPRYLQDAGHVVASLYRPPSNLAASEAEMRAMTRAGLTCLPTPLGRADIQACLTLLRGGGCLVLLADRRAYDVQCQFLGHPAWCATGAAMLHLRTGARIVPVAAIRTGDTTRLEIHPALDNPAAASRQQAAAEITQRLHDIFGAWVQAHPEQWMWNHLRWRPRRRDMQGAQA